MTSIAPYHNHGFTGHASRRDLHSSSRKDVPIKAVEVPSSSSKSLKSDEPLNVNFSNIKAPVNIKPIGLTKVSPVEVEIQEQLTQFQGAVAETIQQSSTSDRAVAGDDDQNQAGFQRAEPAPSASLNTGTNPGGCY